MKYLLSRLFSAVQAVTNTGTFPVSQMILKKKQPSTSLHPGIAHVLKFVEEKGKFAVVQTFAKHSLLSIARFHAATTLSSATLGGQSGLGSRDLRLRFIVYQLLQAIAYVHTQKVCLDAMEPCNVMLDDDMWLFLPIGISERICKAASVSYDRVASPRNSPIMSAADRKKPAPTEQCNTAQNSEIPVCVESIERHIGYNEPMTMRWVNGMVSNFEYLMAINHAAGRTMMDPLYHPIIPWVTDFSCYPVHDSLGTHGGLRDLTKTKFRLSKGDAQLETTYRHSDPPHHVPESLSELTYYIYLARRTPLQVLRRVVRDVFVPEHYPHSMGRIFDWTPDECIPEFYCDPTVFTSIHHDCGLQDIELPSFAPTPSEFIAFHRSVLESDEVSRKLHRWIDLTFGHCLEGAAAVSNMNVPLHHTLSSSERSGIDAPDVNKNPGFVMLFDCPHPRKKVPLPAVSGDSATAAAAAIPSAHLLNFNNSSKYAPKAGQQNMAKDVFSVHNLIQLDHPQKQRSSATKSHSIGGAASKADTTKHDNSALLQANDVCANNISGSFIDDNKSSFHLSSGNTAHRKGGSFSSRKSFLRPPADASLALLRHAGEIVLDDDARASDAIRTIQSEVQQTQFANCFDTALAAIYELPDFPGASGSDYSSSKPKRSEQESGGGWDQDFQDSMRAVLDILESSKPPALDAGAQFIHDAQADDMLAIGCIIAELFTGRPLMNANTAHRIAAAGPYNARKELAQFIYRQTSDLPLVLRRIVTLLVQFSREARPNAVEILQACQKDDENRWTNKDFSLQRSGGCNPGYVDFAKLIAAHRKPAVPTETAEHHHDYDGNSAASATQLPKKLIKYLDAENEKEASSLHLSMRVELLADYCGGLFPTYFRSVYSIVGELKLCRDGLVRMRLLLNKMDDILRIPLEGLNLVIRHILDVVSDAKPFCDPVEEQSRLAKTSNHADNNAAANNPHWVAIEGKKTLIGEYYRIIDVIGMRLGVDGTEKLLVPKVVEFLNDLTSVEMLEHILRSPLWTVLLLRSGVRCFLRCFLPLLLTYISSGTLHHVSNGVRGLGSVVVPLWAKGEYLEYNMWLSSFPLYVVQEVEQAAMSTIVSLMEPECMGPGLCSRYLLPALLSLIGIPQLAGAGYGHSEAEVFSQKDVQDSFEAVLLSKATNRDTLQDHERPDLGEIVSAVEHSMEDSAPAVTAADPQTLQLLEKYVLRHAIYESQDRSVVRTVINLCMQLGDLVVSELILSKIFNSTLPDLVDSLTDMPSPATVAALMEVVVLLNGILPSLCPETVQKDYLQPARISGMSLPRLLAKLPLSPSWSITDDFEEEHMRYRTLDEYINAQRRHNLHFELCRLIASSSMMAGAETCLEHVVPSVDAFFKNFVQAFGLVPIESRTMAKAFELGAELFMPLAQVTGPEAFYTLVPNLNPRLEMWLVSVGSSIPAKSPPLPSNIWPEVTTEVEKEPRKKKGIMGWFSSRIIGSSTPATSSNSATLASGAAATANKASLPVGGAGVDDGDYSPVAERTLQNARTAQSYSASIRKKNATTIGDVNAIKSPNFGTELVTFESQTPMFATAKQSELDADAHQSDPYHLMNTDMAGVHSPLARPLEPISEQALSEEDCGENGATPITLVPEDAPMADDALVAPNLNADLDAEGDADEDDDASFQSLDSHPPEERGSPGEGLTPLPDDVVDDNEGKEAQGNLPEALLVDTIDALLAQNAQPTEGGTHVADGDLHIISTVVDELDELPVEHGISASYLDARDAKHSRPYMAYQRLMAARRHPRASVRNNFSACKTRTTGTGRKGRTGSIFAQHHGDSDNAEEVENRELYYNEMAWLLGGSGRWNIDQDLKEKTATMLQKAAKLGRYHANSGTEWNPAAQMSMTAPRMVTDAASDAGTVFALNMQCNSQWKLEENPGMIRCMAVNPIESMLLTCSRTGVRLWSLTSHPLLHVSSYTHHSAPPFAAGFLRNGTNAATCDGNIHIWDIETRHTISFLSAATAAGYNSHEKNVGFSSMSIISPRDGIMPSMGAYGDDQLITTLNSTLSYHDLRLSSTGRGIIPVADWIIPPLPTPQGSVFSSTTEPLQLTCAASHDNYLFTGSSGGGMWIVDRRMGKVLTSWQAQDGPILRVCFTNTIYYCLIVLICFYLI